MQLKRKNKVAKTEQKDTDVVYGNEGDDNGGVVANKDEEEDMASKNCPADVAAAPAERKKKKTRSESVNRKSKKRSKNDIGNKRAKRSLKKEAESLESDDNGDDNNEEVAREAEENDGRMKCDGVNVYLPSMPLGEDEELVCDPKAYRLHHQVQTGYPCLCFDLIADKASNSSSSPHHFDCYLVAGTQADRPTANRLVVLKFENLHVKKPPNNDDDDDDDDDDDSNSSGSSSDDDAVGEQQPRLFASAIRHRGAVNRVKFSSGGASTPLAAAWSDTGSVGIYDLSPAVVALNSHTSLVGNRSKQKKNSLPRDVADAGSRPLVFSSRDAGDGGHSTEGFALAWSPTVDGQLLSGDCAGKIVLWQPRQAGAGWALTGGAFSGHSASVEDVEWSPSEPSVFCSCSADGSVRVWDTRSASRRSQLCVGAAHASDVNVIAWNRLETSLLLSGGDDSAIKVWDFRTFSAQSQVVPLATFEHHRRPITSVQWCPHDSSVFAASGEDDQVTLWDCSVEPDDDGGGEDNEQNNKYADVEVAPQLLFIHQGQKEIKELRWHPRAEGVLLSVAATGFDVFRTVSV